MHRPTFKNPHRVLVIWGLLWVLGAVSIAVFDFRLSIYAAELRANDYRTYLGEAVILLESKNYLGALQQVERAKSLAPDVYEPYAYAGGIHYRLNQWDLACANFRQAVEKGDPGVGPRLDIVWSLIEMKRFEEAAEFGAKALEQFPEDVTLLQYTAEALLKAARPAEAISYLERALTRTENNVYLLDRLARAQEQKGDPAAAAKIRTQIDSIHEALGRVGNVVP
jgi:tetratricopeptide (TPR) repeat protein